MKFGTLKEVYDKTSDKCLTFDLAMNAIQIAIGSLFDSIYLFTGLAYIVLIVMQVTGHVKWYIHLIMIVSFLLEFIFKYYWLGKIDKYWINLKLSFGDTMLSHYNEYNKMKDWQKKQIKDNLIKDCMGLRVTK